MDDTEKFKTEYIDDPNKLYEDFFVTEKLINEGRLNNSEFRAEVEKEYQQNKQEREKESQKQQEIGEQNDKSNKQMGDFKESIEINSLINKTEIKHDVKKIIESVNKLAKRSMTEEITQDDVKKLFEDVIERSMHKRHVNDPSILKDALKEGGDNSLLNKTIKDTFMEINVRNDPLSKDQVNKLELKVDIFIYKIAEFLGKHTSKEVFKDIADELKSNINLQNLNRIELRQFVKDEVSKNLQTVINSDNINKSVEEINKNIFEKGDDYKYKNLLKVDYESNHDKIINNMDQQLEQRKAAARSGEVIPLTESQIDNESQRNLKAIGKHVRDALSSGDKSKDVQR